MFAAEKAKIAAESLVAGAEVATVARKHGVTRWQVYDWRRRLQRVRLSLPDSLAAMFAPLVVDESLKTRAAVKPALVSWRVVVIRRSLRADLSVANRKVTVML